MLSVGIDEAGAGCFYGPVCASAVILDQIAEDSELIDDSKKLSAKKRDLAVDYIKTNSKFGIAMVSAAEIDRQNILQARIKAMHLAVEDLQQKYNILDQEIILLIDGNRFNKYKNIPYKCIIRGDQTHKCIVAASILAKTHRDNHIISLCDQNEALDLYQIRKNKGYGTAAHRAAITEHGLLPDHRKTFGMCKNYS